MSNVESSPAISRRGNTAREHSLVTHTDALGNCWYLTVGINFKLKLVCCINKQIAVTVKQFSPDTLLLVCFCNYLVFLSPNEPVFAGLGGVLQLRLWSGSAVQFCCSFWRRISLISQTHFNSLASLVGRSYHAHQGSVSGILRHRDCRVRDWLAGHSHPVWEREWKSVNLHR